MRWRILLLLFCAWAAQGATRLTVVVVEPKTGRFVGGLKAEDFSILDDKTPRQVESAEPSTGPLDIMLLLDTSALGEAVQPVASDLIAQLQEKDQMAVVSFHSSADLIQDFTASKDLLRRAVSQVKYGNEPRVLDALYAAIDGGFENSPYKRVLLLVTAGVEGYSRTSEKEVLQVARRNAVSVWPIYLAGYERSMFELLARQTAGTTFNLRDLARSGERQPGARIFETVRQSYVLTVSGNLGFTGKLKVEVKRPQKLFVSAAAVE